ncbi:MAG TPA: hypothetical protein PL110_18700, partial [Candidatus Eremiobacteraeota bacterium]|nr:hypothetical protein [Candidatus Eremiobacteraeota bacterium]
IDPDTGNIVIDDWMGKLRWQNYNIYYTKPDTKNVSKFLLCRREVPLGSKRGEVNSIPLEIFIPDGTTSAPGINTYINGSYTGTERVISRDVIKSLFRRNNYNEIEFFIEVGQPKEDYKDSPGNSKNRIRVIIRN